MYRAGARAGKEPCSADVAVGSSSSKGSKPEFCGSFVRPLFAEPATSGGTTVGKGTTNRAASSEPTPVKNRAIWSMGLWVAERPIRWILRGLSAARRSRVIARWEPRLSRTSAWISSTMTVSTFRNVSRLFGLVSIRYRDSGVVTRMWGGRLSIAARFAAGVSPVRRPTRIGGTSRPRSAASARISASGCSRFRCMSFESARNGEMYTTRISLVRDPCSESWNSRSIAARKAVKVFPLPVGAAIRISRPATISGQPCCCGSVGPAKRE